MFTVDRLWRGNHEFKTRVRRARLVWIVVVHTVIKHNQPKVPLDVVDGAVYLKKSGSAMLQLTPLQQRVVARVSKVAGVTLVALYSRSRLAMRTDHIGDLERAGACSRSCDNQPPG